MIDVKRMHPFSLTNLVLKVMLYSLKCNVKLFANDTSFFTIAHNPYQAALDINHDLNQELGLKTVNEF